MATNKYEWLKEEEKARLAANNKALNEQAANLAVSLANNPASGAKTVSPLAKQKAVTTPATTTTPQAAYDATQPQKDLVSQNLLNEILERPKFSYDYSADPLYQQYREQYLDAGKRAMEDTLGKAVSLTGGYDNSYANAVSQQVYDDYAARAADKIPELYQLALQKYQMEGDELNNRYGLLYGRERDAVSDAQWQAQFDEGVRQFDLTRADQREQFAAQMGLDWAKFEESVRQFGLQHALDQAKYDRSVFESDRDYNRSVFESDRAYDRNVYESDRDYGLSAYSTYNKGSSGGNPSKTTDPDKGDEVDRTNKNGIVTNTDEKFNSAVQSVVDYAMSIEADSEEEFYEKLERYASRYKDWGNILDAAEDMLEKEERKSSSSSVTKPGGSSRTTKSSTTNITGKGGGLVKPNTIRTK